MVLATGLVGRQQIEWINIGTRNEKQFFQERSWGGVWREKKNLICVQHGSDKPLKMPRVVSFLEAKNSFRIGSGRFLEDDATPGREQGSTLGSAAVQCCT